MMLRTLAIYHTRPLPGGGYVSLLHGAVRGLIGLSHGVVNALAEFPRSHRKHPRARLVARQLRYQLVVAILA